MPITQKSLSIFDFEGLFPNEDSCVSHLFNSRFGQNYACPKCDKEGPWYLNKYKRFACSRCGCQISGRSGTVFSYSNHPLRTWFRAMLVFTHTRTGISNAFIARHFGFSHETSWRLANKIRSHMAWHCGTPIFGGAGEHVEIDETLIRGIRRGGKGSCRAIIFGISDRKRVSTMIVPKRNRATLEPIIRARIRPGTIINSDGWRAYDHLSEIGFEHIKCNHKIGQWVSEEGAHTRHLDTYWTTLKRSIRGIHLHVSMDHLEKYIKECEFRHTFRKKPADMFWDLISKHPPPLPFSGKRYRKG
ncbi:IS1595 family transposase [Croceicoccus naphthovorans]|uniref:IS1595 family transposase n=1 Tax=Croceicoccus naphthovorans TaxID=1348774 RepID=UPI0009E1BB96|nr:IS1595 family transposase [Croceicoccus naphthovorans]MBB3992272.1 transposase-like protein [Croceicoccus naphthovorans]